MNLVKPHRRRGLAVLCRMYTQLVRDGRFCRPSRALQLRLCSLFVGILFGNGNDAGGKLDAAACVLCRAHQVIYRLENFAAIGLLVDEQQLCPLDGQLIRRAGKILIRFRFQNKCIRLLDLRYRVVQCEHIQLACFLVVVEFDFDII